MPMSDSQTTVADLKRLVATFVDERDWQQFHAPKNLAMSIAIESAELMEHFQWISVEESLRRVQQEDVREEIAEELADVLCYCLALTNAMELDLAAAIQAKMEKNRRKYPAETFRGRYGHDDPALPKFSDESSSDESSSGGSPGQ